MYFATYTLQDKNCSLILTIFIYGFSSTPDGVFIKSDLLLRIDSMVLTDMIGTGEAAGLRMMILDSKVSVADDFSDIQHKKDAELLAELRHFSDKCKK